MKKFLVGILAVLAAIYLLNLGAGIFELLPDNIPFLGNVDETLAAYILYSAFEYFRGKNIGVFGSGNKLTELKK